MSSILAAAAVTAFLAMAEPIGAQDEPRDDKTMRAPNGAAVPPGAAPAPAPVCTDRPTKANVVCTVPKGAIQIEADLANWTRTGTTDARTDAILYTNPTIKYGLGEEADVEVNIAPYVTVRTRVGAVVDTLGGVGDLYLRVKRQFGGSGPLQAALIPYVKVPTARAGIGNGKVEGGVIAPIVFALKAGVYLNLGPEVDLLANASGRGRHAQLVGLANVSKSIGKAAVYAELWTGLNLDPAGTVRQYSADVAVTYLLRPTLQVDAGGNFGLNRATPDAQLYVGLAKRF